MRLPLCCGFAPRGWWQAVSAAEGHHTAAAAYRQGLKAAIQQRWLLPHLLAAATGATAAAVPAAGTGTGTAGVCSAHARLVQLLPLYAAALGVEAGQIEGAVQQAGPKGGAAGSASNSSSSRGDGATGGRRQLVELGLFSLAEAVQVSC